MSDAASPWSVSRTGATPPAAQSTEDCVFPNVPTMTASVMKKAFKYFKRAFSVSGVTLVEVSPQGEEQPTEGPSGAEVYFDDSNCDERLRGLTHEQALAKSHSLFMEDTAEAIRRSLHDTMSMGDVEMSEIIGSMNLGDRPSSEGEIWESKAGSSSGASSSGASSSYGIV